MKITPKPIRILLGAVALALLASGVILAWREAESATVVGLLAGGVILLIVAVAPTLPAKFALGGGSVEWTAEQLVDRVYSQTLQDELASSVAMGGGTPEEPLAPGGPVEIGRSNEPPLADEGTGNVWPGIETLREQARVVATAAELSSLLSQAAWMAREEARIATQPRAARQRGRG